MSKELKKDEVKEVTEVQEVKNNETPVIDMEAVAKLMQEVAELREKLENKQEEIPSLSQVNFSDVEKYLNEEVPFKAFKDDDKYKDDIVVGINGKNWQIKRGITVMIPRFVYDTIDNAERQRAEANSTSRKYADEFDKETSKRKI